MAMQLSYGAAAKAFHWVTMALLFVQFPIGWLMPDIRRGAVPGTAMTLHVSIGILILVITTFRFLWRLLYPVVPANSLAPWQRAASESLHWLLYGLVFATTLTGWFFASFRGWHISLFFIFPLPTVTAPDSAVGRAISDWHQAAGWSLLVAMGLHITAALVHAILWQDRLLDRMLPARRKR